MATDTYTLSMSYDPREVNDCLIRNGELGLAGKKESDWVNAVDLNSDGTAIFVLGPWEAGYELGTWGVDTQSHTVWAVVNHCGEFVARAFTYGSHHHRRDRIKDHRSRSDQESPQSRPNRAKPQDADGRQDLHGT